MSGMRSGAAAMIAALVLSAQAFGGVLAVDWGGRVTSIENGVLTEIGRAPGPVEALHIAPDGAFAYLATQSGHVVRIDLTARRFVVETRLSDRPIDLIVSGDGRYLLTDLAAARRLLVLNASNFAEIRSIPIAIEGGITSATNSLLTVPARESFVVTFADIPEIWEIPYGDNPTYRGWVHDFRNDGPPSRVPRFPVRRMPLREPLTWLLPFAEGDIVMGFDPDFRRLQALDLYIGRVFAVLDLGAKHAPYGAILWRQGDAKTLAISGTDQPEIALVATADWSLAGRVSVQGRGGRLLAHAQPGRAYRMLDESIEVLDFADRRVVQTTTPRPGASLGPAVIDPASGALLVALPAYGQILTLDPVSLRETGRVAFDRAVVLRGFKSSR